MRLFVGLGNPGAKYAQNRHNIGFMAVDEIARRHGFAPWRRRFQGEVCTGDIRHERVTLLKPLTYMNESGLSVREALRYSGRPEQLIVFHDEIELPFGKVRINEGGGIAGHNGLRSISAHIGNQYLRVRLGIGHPRDIVGKDNPNLPVFVERHVLSDFSNREARQVEVLCDIIAQNIDLLMFQHQSSFLNKIHLGMEGAGF